MALFMGCFKASFRKEASSKAMSSFCFAALKIHVSPDTKDLLDTFNTFVLTTNKVIEPKVKKFFKFFE